MDIVQSLVIISRSAPFTVSALCCIHPALGVRLEVLPQPGAGHKSFATSLTPVWLVTSVDPPMVHKIPLRSESFPTHCTVKGPLSRVFSHVHLQVILLNEALPTLLTQVWLTEFDSNVSVHSVRLQLTISHKTPATEIANKGLLTSVSSDVTFHLSSCSERLVTHSTRIGLHIQVNLDMIPPCRWILERLATLSALVCFFITQLEVRCPHVSLEITWMVELLITVLAIVPGYFEFFVMGLHVATQNAFGHITLAADLTFVLKLFGM